MKIRTISTLILFAAMSLTLNAEIKPSGKAIELSKNDPSFAEFVTEIVESSFSSDHKRLGDITIKGDNIMAWASIKGVTKLGRQKLDIATYDFDPEKKQFVSNGTRWQLSAPADGQLTIDYKMKKAQNSTMDVKEKHSFMVAKTTDGWRIVLPTMKQIKQDPASKEQDQK